MPIPPPRAAIVVDAATGQVLVARNERALLPPASTSKILTALLARRHLALDAEVVVPAAAALVPARRLQLPPDTLWRVDDLVRAMMLCSCNDAAWTLGLAAGGGTAEGFEARAAELARDLGLDDGPVLRDPAGLDGPRGLGGGNLMSARDLAIAARAYLADPELAAIAVQPVHEWTGGDGKPHVVRNLNDFLGRYEGAIGVKTGFTSRAGLTFVGAARRDGRTLIAVVLRSDAHYAAARALLDEGFALVAAGRGTADVLPPVPDPAPPPTTTASTTTAAPAPPSSVRPSSTAGASSTAPPVTVVTGSGPPLDPRWAGVAVGGVTGAAALAVLARRRTRRSRGSGIDRRPARRRRRRS